MLGYDRGPLLGVLQTLSYLVSKAALELRFIIIPFIQMKPQNHTAKSEEPEFRPNLAWPRSHASIHSICCPQMCSRTLSSPPGLLPSGFSGAWTSPNSEKHLPFHNVECDLGRKILLGYLKVDPRRPGPPRLMCRCTRGGGCGPGKGTQLRESKS